MDYAYLKPGVMSYAQFGNSCMYLYMHGLIFEMTEIIRQGQSDYIDTKQLQNHNKFIDTCFTILLDKTNMRKINRS